MLRAYKNRPTHAPTSWDDLGPPVSERSAFFPSFILNSYAHLQSRRMGAGQVFSNAHDIAISGGTFYTADTVCGMAVRYRPSKLIVRISGRCTSTTSTIAIGRHPIGPFHSRQTPAIGSLGVQKSLPSSRGIFLPTQMIPLRIESSSCCMVWGVLEKLRFA